MKPERLDDLPGVIGFAQAIKSVRDLDFCLSAKFKEQQHRAERHGADPDILEFERTLVRRMKKLGVPMFAHCIVRNEAAQHRAYVTGTSKARWGQSPHNFGLAVDIIHGTRGWEIPRKAWDVVGHEGKEVAKAKGIRIVWGGDWKFWDPAHFELKNWRSRVSATA